MELRQRENPSFLKYINYPYFIEDYERQMGFKRAIGAGIARRRMGNEMDQQAKHTKLNNNKHNDK